MRVSSQLSVAALLGPKSADPAEGGYRGFGQLIVAALLGLNPRYTFADRDATEKEDVC